MNLLNKLNDKNFKYHQEIQSLENDLAINHGLYLEKEEQLDLLVAANEERVKKLDKLI